LSPAKTILFASLAILAVAFVAIWTYDLNQKRRGVKPTLFQLAVGFLTDFLDTLGIGSFAVTTTLYRMRKTVPDDLIPGTLNVGHCLPTIVQAFIYIAVIDVDMRTLILSILAAVLGAWLGAGFVAKWPLHRIQRGMGLALLVAAGLILARLCQLLPPGGDATGLQGTYLAVALIGNFLFGALMMIGVGAYAPIMIMVSLLGMNPTTAFPIMMGSCAFLMPVAGMRIIQAGTYDSKAALGLTLAGIPGVLLAAFVVKELPLDIVRWLVEVVVIYTAISLLWAASRKKRSTLITEQ
jgi:uncharacterized membrane protein YfcA